MVTMITDTTIAKMETIVRNWDAMTSKIATRFGRTYNCIPDSFLLEDMATHTAQSGIVARLRAILKQDDTIDLLAELREELTYNLLNIRFASSTSQASNLIDNRENEFLAEVVRKLSGGY